VIPDTSSHWEGSPNETCPFPITSGPLKFAVIVYETAHSIAAREDPERSGAYWGAYMAYARALEEAGVAAGGAGLQPPATATSLRLRGGQRQVQDGPFADTKDLLGGFFLIDVEDLDAALTWAERCPGAADNGVEVRPLLPPVP